MKQLISYIFKASFTSCGKVMPVYNQRCSSYFFYMILWFFIYARGFPEQLTVVVVFSFLIGYMNNDVKFMREFLKTNNRVVRAADT